jgi:hypothetical protein
MKATIVAAAAAALVGSASASQAHEGHRHVHELFHAEKRGHKSENETCVASCTTIYSYVTGAATRKRNLAPGCREYMTKTKP